VIALDVNILIFAYDVSSQHPGIVRPWLEEVINREDIGLPVSTLWGFLRFSTSGQFLSRPVQAEASFRIVGELLRLPQVHVLQPGPRHFQLLQEIATPIRFYGRRLSDAVQAAIAIEHDAVLASTDTDFARFPDLKWINPVA